MWTTKDGRKIPYPELSDRHLLNVIGYLQTVCGYLKARAETGMVMGPQPSGDMAQHAFDQELRQLEDMDARTWMESHHNHYPHLVSEAGTRDLKVPDRWPTEEEQELQGRAQFTREFAPAAMKALKGERQ